VNENDNSRNRKYENKQGDGLDQLVSKTYAASSAASNLNALSDPYVKAFRWASDRIGDEGLVAYISNNSFLEGLAFDGLRACLEREFDAIYHLDLGGNVRKNPKLSGTTHNVFGIQVGVGITFLVRHKERRSDPGRVWYARMDEFWTKEQKYAYLDQAADLEALPWRELTPDARHTWLTGGLRAEWDDLLPLGSKEAKREARRGKDTEVVFRSYGRGIATSRDSWAYNYDRAALAENMGRMIGAYNDHVARWERFGTNKPDLDSFVNNDAAEIVWSRDLKADLKRKRVAEFAEAKIRRALYRPFTRQSLFFDPIMNEEIYQLPALFPTAASESENRAICVTDRGSEKAFMCLMTDAIPDLHLVGAGASAQVFPFYTYHETPGGLERRENITDWALARAQAHYGAGEITKWDLFYYAYALLHHPTYRQRYAADLKRDLPRLPLEPDFAAYAAAGRRLAEHHLGYEAAAPYPLRFIETPGASLDWRVEKMRLGREKDQIVVNPFLTLGGVPEQAFAYRLGHRSALEWVLDQYQVTVDARSGLRNDPNRPEDPEYIVRLVGQVIAVSLETVEIVAALPPLVG
jgi:predicted helicase